MWDELGPCIPLRRSGLPEDIAKTINFLISDDADYITGVTIRVDGGLILAGMPEDGKSKWNFFNFIYLILNLHVMRYIWDVMVNYATIFNKIHIQMLALLGRSEVLYFL